MVMMSRRLPPPLLHHNRPRHGRLGVIRWVAKVDACVYEKEHEEEAADRTERDAGYGARGRGRVEGAVRGLDGCSGRVLAGEEGSWGGRGEERGKVDQAIEGGHRDDDMGFVLGCVCGVARCAPVGSEAPPRRGKDCDQAWMR